MKHTAASAYMSLKAILLCYCNTSLYVKLLRHLNKLFVPLPILYIILNTNLSKF